MRIIAGSLGGRNFSSPGGHRTHPMSDKLRGALFSTFGDIEGLTVLDPFAGSGALSFEAISRGAASAVAIDLDKSAQTAIAESIQSLNLQDQVKLIKASASAWSQTNPDAQFDLLLIDPPYDNPKPDLLQKLTKHAKPNGLIVVSWPGKQPALELNGCQIISHKNYGDAQLVFYRRIG